MTKLIAIFFIVLALLGAWKLFLYWDQVNHEEETARKQAAASVVNPDQLPGVPYQLDASLRAAKTQGTAGLGAWLKAYGAAIQDPRKAWLELDYCVAIARENPAEAKRLFADVKDRTPVSSPVWPRIKQLEKTYE